MACILIHVFAEEAACTLTVCMTPVHLSHATNTKELPHKRNHAEPGSSVSHRPGKHFEVRCNKAAEPCPSYLSGLCATSAAFILGVLLHMWHVTWLFICLADGRACISFHLSMLLGYKAAQE